MTFLEPAFLWGLALAAPLVGVYLLKVRPRRVPVTALFLWDRVFVEKKTSALFRRLRDLLSLLIMMAALVALVFASARPTRADADSRDIVIIVDNSASMSARDSGAGARLERAKREARSLVAALSDGRRAAVASVGDELEMRCFLTEDRRELRDAIEGIGPSEFPSRPRALASLKGLEALSEEVRVVLISDRVGERFEAPGGVDVIGVGDTDAGRNAGFVAADLLAHPSRDELTLLFQIGATPDMEGREAEVRLLRDGALIKIVPVMLGAGLGSPSTLSASGAPGRYELRLDVDDDRADDNVAYLVARRPEPLRVAVSRSARFFFGNAVLAFERSEGLMRLADEGGPADLSLDIGADGGAVSPRLGSIVFAPSAETPWAVSVGEALPAPIPRVLREHPAFTYVPIESVAFSGARLIEPPIGAAVLVEDEAGNALVWQARGDAGSALVFNMDPAAGDFVLSPYFPLVVRGASAFLGGRSAAPRSTYGVGDRIDPPGATPESVASLVSLESDAEDPTLGSGDISDDGTLRFLGSGFLAVDSRSGAWDVSSSAIAHGEIQATALEPAPAVDDLPRGRPVWTWLVLAAVLALALEEALYHRRRVG